MIRVLELFAGVGGFRIGLEELSAYQIVWSNQWEPATKKQHASDVYIKVFGNSNHSNEDISKVKLKDIPKHHDLLVGGFPCQDYSVATSLVNSKGLLGKKGVLWWSIHRIIKAKKTKYLFLENVDRLLVSPASQRGRDFAVMLKSLDELGYGVEWRVINAADYGMPQRRKRVFILAYKKNTPLYKMMHKANYYDWLIQDGVIAKAFNVAPNNKKKDIDFELQDSLVEISDSFNKNGKISPFFNSGIMINGHVYSMATTAKFKGDDTTLRDFVELNKKVDDEFYITSKELSKWEYLKGAKKEKRTTKNEFQYFYAEGKMGFPDCLDKPSRTIITGEGGRSPSRFKHVIKTKFGLRRLIPIELERLNMFPENHTKLEGCTDTKRAFFMGNALVVGVIKKIGHELASRL